MADGGAADPARQRTIEFSKTDRGTSWRGVRLDDDGGLAIQGHDLGPATEYEFVRRLTAAETSILRGLLEVPVDGDLLAAVAERFATTHALEAFVKEHGIAGSFWNHCTR